ncbi:MAG TPA: methyltransferase domain-containing protein [Methylomirabilota bacterium]|nr:methyltransferase domain-containing protein [Methylomirabilota bacterium]
MDGPTTAPATRREQPAVAAANRRLHWACGSRPAPGWTNSDLKPGPGVELACDIRHGLPLPDDSFDYVASMHGLQEIPCLELVPVLRELRRVLKPAGVLRLGLPDLDRAIRAYVENDRGYFLIADEEVESLAGKLSVQMTWYGNSRTLLTYDFVAELAGKAGFAEIRRSRYRETASPYPGIVELDNRPKESFFVEAVK